MRLVSLFFGAAFLISYSVFGQARKPELMVFPNDNYMSSLGYYTEAEIDGTVRRLYDYKKAYAEDHNLVSVTLKIQQLFLERGFKVLNIYDELKKLENERANDLSITTKSGAEAVEDVRDVFLQRASPDIVMEFGFSEIKGGFGTAGLQVNLAAKDAYSGAPIAATVEIIQPSPSSLESKIEAAIIANINSYQNQINNYFTEMFEIGREIIISVRILDDSPFDFEEDMEYAPYDMEDEFAYILEEYMNRATVKARFTIGRATSNRMDFEQCRIPLFNDKGRPVDARNFGNDMRKFLKEEPFDVPCKVVPNGLGSVIILIGSK